jgi:septal ring factor EnvC (AmiA/AmiB activator)
METINGLLKALDNKVPASMAKRLDGLGKLNQKLAVVREEHNENPTEESQEKLDEIVEFITDTQDDLIEDLSELVAKKREADAKARQIAKNKADAEAKQRAEKQANEAKEKEELEQKELEEKEKEPIVDDTKTDPKKKSGIGWGGLIVGGALLILSAGAINYFGKKR